MGDSIWSVAVGDISAQVEHSIERAAPAGKRDIQVDKDNVLKVAKTIQDVVDKEGQDVSSWLMFAGRVLPPGGDTVSGEMAPAWNERLFTAHDSHYRRIEDYIRGMSQLVENLRKTAKQYGYNDEEIAQALGNTGQS